MRETRGQQLSERRHRIYCFRQLYLINWRFRLCPSIVPFYLPFFVIQTQFIRADKLISSSLKKKTEGYKTCKMETRDRCDFHQREKDSSPLLRGYIGSPFILSTCAVLKFTVPVIRTRLLRNVYIFLSFARRSLAI